MLGARPGSGGLLGRREREIIKVSSLVWAVVVPTRADDPNSKAAKPIFSWPCSFGGDRGDHYTGQSHMVWGSDKVLDRVAHIDLCRAQEETVPPS